MKNINRHIIIIYAIALTLALSRCSFSDDNILRIIIGTDTGNARTISPVFSAQNFIRYDITIEGEGHTFSLSSTTPDFVLEDSVTKAVYPNGLPSNISFTISVKGYRAGENSDNYSAFGSKVFTLTPGATTVFVSISPVTDAGTTGTLRYTITGNGIVFLQPYSGFDPEIETEPGSLPGTIPLTVDGNTYPLTLPSGFYVLYYNGLIDVILIYKNFTTEVSLNL